jgi:hypothetical protein
MESGVFLALTLLFVVHVIAFVLLFGALGGELVQFFRLTPADGDDDGGSHRPDDDPPAPLPGGGDELFVPDDWVREPEPTTH